MLANASYNTVLFVDMPRRKAVPPLHYFVFLLGMSNEQGNYLETTVLFMDIWASYIRHMTVDPITPKQLRENRKKARLSGDLKKAPTDPLPPVFASTARTGQQQSGLYHVTASGKLYIVTSQHFS